MVNRGAIIRWWCIGSLMAGALDITYAIVFHYFRRGTSPIRILQSVASGLLGRDAYQGGMATAGLGLTLHFFIAAMVTLIFFLAAARFPSLLRRPLLNGALYGLGVYAVMNYVVIPLSRIRRFLPFVPVVAISGILVHMICIGVPVAWAASKALRTESRGSP